MSDVFLKVQNLRKTYTIKKNIFSSKIDIKAVNNISFDINKGEILGLIGESGSGKSTCGELVMGLLKKDAGNIIFDGVNICELKESEIRKLRKDIQIIFQYTQDTLDANMTIEKLIIEPLKIHNIVKKHDYDKEVNRLLDLVQLSPNEKYKFPRQISGGQKQRVVIARAIASRPKFIVCDEPISALDVSVQGQVLNLLLDLKKELNLTYLFISHDLKVVKHICDRIAVMYKGNIVEIGKTDDIINNPQNEYTKSLINSMM